MPNYSLKSPENTDEWDRYLLFRWEMLRKPLGMSMESLADDIEDQSFHLMGIDHDGNVIASGRVHFNSEHEAQIRYMAVDDKFKRQGIGSEIVTELENYAISNGFLSIVRTILFGSQDVQKIAFPSVQIPAF